MIIYLLLSVIALAEFICIMTIPAFHKPNIYIVVLGIVNIGIGLGVGYMLPDPQRDDDFYLSKRPVVEKLARMQPGCHGCLLALIYTLVGLFMLGIQTVVYLKGSG